MTVILVNPVASGRAVFTPSIASEILHLHPRTLMIYESENLIKPQRTATNRRAIRRTTSGGSARSSS